MIRFISIVAILALYSCNAKKEESTKIIFHIKGAANKKFWLEQLPFEEGKIIQLDSATSKKDIDSIVFTVPGFDERVLRITAPEVNMNILLVTDAPIIDVYGNYGNTALFSLEGSPGSSAIKQFTARQDSIAAKETDITAQINIIKKINGSKKTIDSLQTLFNNHLAYFYKQYVNFEDTISSPAAFMVFYNNVDFGNDHTGLKKFVLKAANRFKGFQPIQQLKQEALDLIKIYEEEYNVGDNLPAITLPDQFGHSFSTSSLKGKYYLINFWSTWCPQCIPYNDQEKILKTQTDSNHFQIINVAIDAEKENWQKLIAQENLNWPQLIDEKMWQGEAVRTLKFDSIPFNFLVSPEGKIIAKAIKPDSLRQIVLSSLKAN